MTVGLGAALGILGIHSIMDLYHRKINLVLTVVCLTAGLIWQAAGGHMRLPGILMALLPGGILLGAAYLTGQKIGYGDGWTVAATGIWTGFWDIFLILTGGMVACAVFSAVLLSMKKLKRGDSLPFIPFLLVGCIGRLMI